MNTDQRQLLRDALMEGVPIEKIVEAEALVDKTLASLEPIINIMLDAARDGADPLDWTEQDVAFEFYPDGDDVLVKVDAGVRQFNISLARSRMRSLGEAMIRESGA